MDWQPRAERSPPQSATFTWVGRRPWILALALLSLCTLVFFARRLDGAADAFLYRPGDDVSDLTVTFWPNIHYIQQALRSTGELPLWRTLIFSGFPLDADPQSGLWYPPNAVFLLLPAAVGFNLLFVVHVVAAGLGQWVWSRATGTSSGGALVAALAYAFTPKTFAHLGFGHAGLVYAAAYVPWVLWAAYRVGYGSWGHLAGLGLALGWQFIAHPQLAFYTGLVAGAYGLATGCIGRRCCGKHARERRVMVGETLPNGPEPASHPEQRSVRVQACASAIGRMAAGAILTLGVAAVQLVPMLGLAPQSARAGMGFSESAVSSLPPRYLWGLLLADHRGFMDYVLYVGIPVLALAIAAARRRQARLWWGFVLLSLIYALGANTPLYGWAFRLLPALAWLRAPSRIWFVTAAVLALLAGWGGDRLLAGMGARSRRALNLAAVALGALALALMLGYAVFLGRPPTNLVALGTIATATAMWCIVTAARLLPRWASAAGFAILVLADLWVVDATMIEGRPSEAVFAEPGLGAYLAAHTDETPFRVYSPSYSLPRHIAARYGLETADGVDPLHLEAYAAYMEVASGVPRRGYGETIPAMYGVGPFATLNRDAAPNLALLGLLNVRYVAAEFPIAAQGLHEVGRFGATYLYENSQAFPRAFVVGRVEPVEDFPAALAWLRSRDAGELGSVAVVEGGEMLASGEVESTIVWEQRSPNRLTLRVTLSRPGFLVLSQVWYPGWEASLDGRPAQVWRADVILSGVYLSSGEHTVTFSYRPLLTYVGGCVSGTTLVVLCLAMATRSRNKRCATVRI